jgi:membrane protease YdiL (CAAX protease family)
MGLNFYIIFIITGSLWAPIIFHFLFDFSILAMGNKPKLDNADPVANIIAISSICFVCSASCVSVLLIDLVVLVS